MHDMFPPFLACVTCTFNRFAPSWFIFVLLRFAAVAMIASPRMDVVRTLGILSVIEAPYYYLWKLSLYTWYSEDYNITPLERFGDYYTQVFQIGILQAIALLAISRINYFRSSGALRIQVWRPFLIVPLFLGIHYVQSVYAFSYGSTKGF